MQSNVLPSSPTRSSLPVGELGGSVVVVEVVVVGGASQSNLSGHSGAGTQLQFSRFKVRVTSRDTGRKVDLNLYFKPPTIIRVEDALNDLVRLRYDLLEGTPALVEDRIQEIKSRLESVNVSIEDVGAQLEDRLKQIFGEGNYEEFLEQFQGRDAG